MKNKLSQIFKMEIYLGYGLVYYKRIYNKIFIILANVFPLFRLVLYFFKKFTKFIKISFTKRDLSELIFINKKIQKSLLKIENMKDNFIMNQTKENMRNKSILDNSKDEINKKIKIIPSINNILKNIENFQKNIPSMNSINSQINNDNIAQNNNKIYISLTNENAKKNVIGKIKEKEISLINSNKKSLVNKESSILNNSFINNNNTENKLLKKKVFISISILSF